MSLADDVKSLALDLGFHAVGITSAEPFEEAERALTERHECGLLEGTGFDPETIRLYTHPRDAFSSASSVISVALSYLVSDSLQSKIQNPKSKMPEGLVARFARGMDYHQVLQERLSRLADAIREKLGHHAEIRSYADTGPLVDRSAAIRAGIGSRGKNTCVYVGEYASWVVLGEMVTDIELEPDEPAPLDVCGECDECVKACPTGAICAPYVVDVRICLSQATQMKGSIPYWLREKLGNRVYGCDTCQSACPLNRDAKPGNVYALHPSAGLGADPELLPLLSITPQEFKARIAPTTVGWIRRTRFRRNVAVALGNIGDPSAVPGLIEALSDPEPVIRAHAAWVLGRIGTPTARHAIESALARETDGQVIEEMRRALEGSP